MSPKDPLVTFNTRLPLSIVEAIEKRIAESKRNGENGIDDTKTGIAQAAFRLYLGMDKPEKKSKAAKTK